MFVDLAPRWLRSSPVTESGTSANFRSLCTPLGRLRSAGLASIVDRVTDLQVGATGQDRRETSRASARPRRGAVESNVCSPLDQCGRSGDFPAQLAQPFDEQLSLG